MVNFSCKFLFCVLKGACFKYGLYFFAHFVYDWNFGPIWGKITEWFIRIEKFDFGSRFPNYGVPFCSFWTWKRLLA